MPQPKAAWNRWPATAAAPQRAGARALRPSSQRPPAPRCKRRRRAARIGARARQPRRRLRAAGCLPERQLPGSAATRNRGVSGAGARRTWAAPRFLHAHALVVRPCCVQPVPAQRKQTPQDSPHNANPPPRCAPRTARRLPKRTLMWTPPPTPATSSRWAGVGTNSQRLGSAFAHSAPRRHRHVPTAASHGPGQQHASLAAHSSHTHTHQPMRGAWPGTCNCAHTTQRTTHTTRQSAPLRPSASPLRCWLTSRCAACARRAASTRLAPSIHSWCVRWGCHIAHAAAAKAGFLICDAHD